jgi:hypothetical protein
MTLQSIIEDAKSFSAQASTNARYLAAGGLAVIWALAEGKPSGLRHWYMVLAVLGFVLALFADFMHYSNAARRLSDVIERNRAARIPYESQALVTDADLTASWWFRWKMRILIAAYIFLAVAFVAVVFPGTDEAARRFMACVAG